MSPKTAYSVTLAGTLLAACGCHSRASPSGALSPGEIARAEGKLKIEQGDLMIRGEKMVLEGRARKARGDALAEQGRRISGARAARRGELLIRWGEAMIEVAREMETEIGPPPATRVDDEGNDGPPAGPPQPGAP